MGILRRTVRSMVRPIGGVQLKDRERAREDGGGGGIKHDARSEQGRWWRWWMSEQG